MPTLYYVTPICAENVAPLLHILQEHSTVMSSLICIQNHNHNAWMIQPVKKHIIQTSCLIIVNNVYWKQIFVYTNKSVMTLTLYTSLSLNYEVLGFSKGAYCLLAEIHGKRFLDASVQSAFKRSNINSIVPSKCGKLQSASHWGLLLVFTLFHCDKRPTLTYSLKSHPHNPMEHKHPFPTSTRHITVTTS